MSIKTKPQTFVSHGREFQTQAEAERHDQLHTAKEKYFDAQQVFQKALAKSQKTADGLAFELGLSHDYYFLVGLFGFPHLRTVSFMGWNLTAQEDEFGVTIRDDSDGKSIWYRISELYAKEVNAEKALAEAQFGKLKEWAEKANELRQKIGLHPLKILVNDPYEFDDEER